MAHVCISHVWRAETDTLLAREIAVHLRKAGHTVFTYEDLSLGDHWGERILMELRRSEFLICLFSEEAIVSQDVNEEIGAAIRAKVETGRPRILPVRLAYWEPYFWPLSATVGPLPWTCWETPEDTPRLLRELDCALSGEPLPLSGWWPPADPWTRS